MASRKTFSFAIMHMCIAFGVVYLITGSLALGGVVALLEPAVNTVAYFFHEMLWERRVSVSGQGRRPAATGGA